MNQIGEFALTCILVAINLQVPVEADQFCDRSNCSFFLTNQEAARKQFAQIDHSKIWLVYLNLTEHPKESSDSNKLALMLTWTQSPNSPFLTFDSNFEVYSFSVLTEAVTQMNIQATSVGADPLRDCLDQLPLNCRNRTIAQEILSNVTDMNGAVCFGDRGVSPSRRCCEQSNGDIKCGIEPQSGWRWLNISYLSALFGIAGYFSILILLCLFPQVPDSQNGIEVISLLDPSPLSLFNVFVKCFNYKPAHCFRDVFVTFCCRIFVWLGLFPSFFYLNIIAFRAFSKKVYFASESDGVNVFYGCYVIFSVYVASGSVVAFLEYFLQCDNRESCCQDCCRKDGFCFALYIWLLKSSYVALEKPLLNYMTAECQRWYWYLIPFCCQDKREISKLHNFPAGLYFVLSPCLFVVLGFVVLCVVFFSPAFMYILAFRATFSDNSCLTFYIFYSLSLIVFGAHIIIIIHSCIALASFSTYTIIGLILSYKVYLPLFSAAILAVSYTYQFYRSTNESYDDLRRITFEVCTEMQAELNNDNRNHHSTAGPSLHLEEQGQNGEQQPPSNQPHQLIYVDKNGSQLIPKKLFDKNICWEIKPIGFAFFVLGTKVFGILLFIITLVGVVLTLTPRSEFGTLTQAAITIFLGGLPQIFSVFSKNSAMEKGQAIETKSRIRRCVKNYLEKGELSEEQFWELQLKRASEKSTSLFSLEV